MHGASLETEMNRKDGGDVLVAIAALVTEGRVPEKLSSKTKGFYEGPHCPVNKAGRDHHCDLSDILCSSFGKIQEQVIDLWKKNIPVCVEVLLTCSCKNDVDFASSDTFNDALLLEKWYFSTQNRRNTGPLYFNFLQLMSAIRSQLYFSQLTAWLTTQDEATVKITKENLRYRLTLPGETYEPADFTSSANRHDFPLTDIGNGYTATVSFLSLPRMSSVPSLQCQKCAPEPLVDIEAAVSCLLDDRMHTVCTLKGKHRCEDFEDVDNIKKSNNSATFKRLCQKESASSSTKPKLTVDIHRRGAEVNFLDRNLLNSHKTDLTVQDKGKLLLDAIERSALRSTKDECMNGDRKCDENCVHGKSESSDNGSCDMSERDIFSIKDVDHCDSPIPQLRHKRIRDVTNIDLATTHRKGIKKKLSFDDDGDVADLFKVEHVNVEIPSALEQEKFRKDLDNAASMVFHSRTGLPLTSSPAPVRRGRTCFDFDSSINSVSAIKSALFPTSAFPEDDSESEGSIASPCSPESIAAVERDLPPLKYRRKGHAASLLGSFEESVLNGRLEPVSTVHGFTADLAASGSFSSDHLHLPVTAFFYTLGDNDKVSTPYLGHINLGKKGYLVPRAGAVQVTLFNPLGTVVKMFVVMYDLSDMPPTSHTFIRQRTLYMPINCKENIEWGPKWLRYLIHLRFQSSKSGRIYLHTDIRLIVFRKSDEDTATELDLIQKKSYELRSFVHMPTNPKYSPTK